MLEQQEGRYKHNTCLFWFCVILGMCLHLLALDDCIGRDSRVTVKGRIGFLQVPLRPIAYCQTCVKKDAWIVQVAYSELLVTSYVLQVCMNLKLLVQQRKMFLP